MRYVKAVDRFLEHMQLEHDWTPRTVDSVYRALVKLADDIGPEAMLAQLDGRPGKEIVRSHLGRLYGRLAASTRATRISYFHSFFAWAEDEELIADDRVREIKRPPKRKPNTYKPTESEITLTLMAATERELAPLLLMSGLGLRAAETVSIRWRDLDLTHGQLHVLRKGQNWQWLPVKAPVLDRLRDVYRSIEPDPADHVFVAERELWASAEHRVRTTIDPKTPRTPKALWSMVGRVSERAGVRKLGPHQLRRGFANQFLRDTRSKFGVADTHTLKHLMSHAKLDTTELYLEDLTSEDAAEVLRRLYAEDVSQSEGTGPYLALTPGFPLMEAAGIEPASSVASSDSTSVSGSDDDLARPDASQASPAPETESDDE